MRKIESKFFKWREPEIGKARRKMKEIKLNEVI
jgi:hypothetical protein